MIKITITILILCTTVHASEYRRVNSEIEASGISPYLHVACSMWAMYVLTEKYEFSRAEAALIVIAIGILKESTDRNFDIEDVGANCVGIGFSFAF